MTRVQTGDKGAKDAEKGVKYPALVSDSMSDAISGASV